jgi:zinc/manganese transport system permease protein
MGSGLSWDLFYDVQLMFSYPFMVNAFRAGTIVAVIAATIGWFMVLRRQSFAGHTLAVVGFPGAAAATWLGVATGYGYFGFCVAGALVIAALPQHTTSTASAEQSAVIGTVQAFALACGYLFVSLYKGFLSGMTNLLFGTIVGVTDTQVLVLLASAVPCLAVLIVIGRPLLFASVDPDLARARGVPVRAIGALFLVLLGVAAAGTSQVTGSLLVFALLVAPAATARKLTTRPSVGIALSIAFGLLATWIGETLAFFTVYPIGFWVTTVSFAGYLAASLWRVIADRARRSPRVTAPAAALAGARP